MRPTTPAIIGAWIVAAVAIVAPAAAQDAPPSPIEVELRREIATLRDRLATAEERIRRLEAEREELLKSLAEARRAASGGDSAAETGLSDPTEPRAPVPEDPFASPASMLQELRERYEAEFQGVPHDTDPAIADYQEDVQAWCKAGVRDLRDRREWLVKVVELAERPDDRRNYDAKILVIDEATGLPIGDPISTMIDARDARKIEAGKDRFAYWRATVVIAASPIYNEKRPEAGVFEHPPFVGRYCEFGIELEWRMFQGVRAEAVEKQNPDQPTGR